MEVKKCIYYFLNNVLNHIFRKDLLNYILHNFLLRLKANIFCNTKFDYFLLIKFVNNQIQFNQINNILPYIFYMLYSNEVNNFKFLEYKNFILHRKIFFTTNIESELWYCFVLHTRQH